MNQGLYQVGASLINQFNRVDSISHNLANVNTNGFKQEKTAEGSFNHYLEQQKAKNLPINKESAILNTIPKIDSKYIDGSLGAIVPTGNPLDLAITQEESFFRVMDTEGNISLTRDGNFKNLDGHLVNKSSEFVLDRNGEPIFINNEEDVENLKFNVGIVSTNLDNLEKIGGNNYKLKDENQFLIIEQNNAYIEANAVEKSNVNSVSAMVELIDAHRRLEQGQKVMKSIDEINAKVIEKLGDNK